MSKEVTVPGQSEATQDPVSSSLDLIPQGVTPTPTTELFRRLSHLPTPSRHDLTALQLEMRVTAYTIAKEPVSQPASESSRDPRI